MIKESYEYLSVQYIWLFDIIMSYAFQSESTIYFFPIVNKLYAQSRRNISTLSDWNRTQTYNHIVRKATLNHLASRNKSLSRVQSTYIHSVFDRMLSSCQVRISQWMHTLGLPQYQQALFRNRRHIISLSDTKGTRTHNHLIWKQTLNHFVKLTNDWAEFWVLICNIYLTLCYYHVT